MLSALFKRNAHLKIADYALDNLNEWFTVKDIQEGTGLSRKNIYDAIEDLIESDFLAKEKRNQYKVNSNWILLEKLVDFDYSLARYTVHKTLGDLESVKSELEKPLGTNVQFIYSDTCKNPDPDCPKNRQYVITHNKKNTFSFWKQSISTEV